MAALPQRAFMALARAKGHLAANEPLQAIADLEKVLKKAPKSAEAWWVMAKAKAALSEHADAEQCFRRAGGLMPKSYDIWFGLGHLLATQEYEKAMSRGGGGYTLHLNAGECAYYLDDVAKAARYAGAALAASAGDEVATRHLEMAQRRLTASTERLPAPT